VSREAALQRDSLAGRGGLQSVRTNILYGEGREGEAMNATKIEWADATWNPTSGCTAISEGCQNCWAKRMANRQRGRNGYPADDPFRVTFHPDRLDEPLGWKKPRRIAVSLMGDLFHGDVPDEWIDKVFAIMTLATQHTFLVLTKRPERLAEYLASPDNYLLVAGGAGDVSNRRVWPGWPLPNVWLGTSVENQQAADERIPWLMKCPVAVRFLSMEPLLGPVELSSVPQRESLERYDGRPLDWVIVGGESGPGARPMHPDWVRSIRDQCQAASVPFFFKQWGEWLPLDQGCGCNNSEVESDAIAHVGKKAAGRLLDGRQWDEMPEIELTPSP
jgi:protein gp37